MNVSVSAALLTATPLSPRRFFIALSSWIGAEASPLEEDEIQRLVSLARAGDRKASQRIYRQYVQRVYRTVRGMLHSEADAEDVTQDAMLNVLSSLHRYTPQTGTRFIAWVTTIAVNTTRRRFRRQQPEFQDPDALPDLPDDRTNPEHEANTAQRRSALLRALAALAPRERDIVCMRYGAELNATEIAQLVHLEPANVRKIVERTRDRLRAALIDY